MQNLGKLTNHHAAFTTEELEALINACGFFFEYHSGQADPDWWRTVARDQRLELFDQLATRLALLAD